jgi:hypothetical protein
MCHAQPFRSGGFRQLFAGHVVSATTANGFALVAPVRGPDEAAQIRKRSSEFRSAAGRASYRGCPEIPARGFRKLLLHLHFLSMSGAGVARECHLPFEKIETNAMRRIRSSLGALTGLTLLAAGLALMDDRVRYAIVRLLDGELPGGDIAAAGGGMRDTSTFALQLLRDQSMEYAPLTLFALGAMVLVFFMTRT